MMVYTLITSEHLKVKWQTVATVLQLITWKTRLSDFYFHMSLS